MTEYTPLRQLPSAVLLDTDIGPDCDDAGALALLCGYAAQYRFPILGVGNCTSNPYGAGCVDAIASFCGFPDLPIGSWPHPGFLEDGLKYNREVARRFSPRSENGILPPVDAVEMYRSLLEGAEDGGAVVVAIGPLNNLAALLDVDAELVRRKVRALVCMAADIERRVEYNIACDAPAAKKVFAKWPTPIFVSGFALGVGLRTGFAPDDSREDNPIFVSYNRYTAGANQNASFDLTAVDFAVEGEGDRWRLTEPGKLVFHEDNATEFVPQADGNVRFLVKNAPDQAITDALNARIRAF